MNLGIKVIISIIIERGNAIGNPQKGGQVLLSLMIESLLEQKLPHVHKSKELDV